MNAKFFAAFSGARRGASIYSSRDLLEYRNHYPDNTDDPRKNKNLLFFQNKYPMQPEGVLIEEVLRTWKGKYRHLESSHSFIQWLFPIQEKGMNYESQVLQKHEIASMRADPTILRRVVGVFKIMLDFYGMELVDEEKGLIQRLSEPNDFRPQYRNLNYSSHNYLRITRILKNLGEMGFEHLKIGWLECLFNEICIERLLPNCESSFWNYWSGTIYDDVVRDTFLKKCERRLEEARAPKKRGENSQAASSNPAPTPPETSPAPPETSPTPPEKADAVAQPAVSDAGAVEEEEGVADTFSSSTAPSSFTSTPSRSRSHSESEGDNSNCEPRK